MTKFLLLTVLVAITLLPSKSRGIEPATIMVDRNWSVPESTQIGTIVKTVHVQGKDNKTINYTLELDDPFSPNQENPFWIDPTSGYVYLNKTLDGRANQRPFILSVGVDDGSYSVKNQVRVTITGLHGSNRNDNFIPPKELYPKLPNIGSLPTPFVRDGGNGGFYLGVTSTKAPTTTTVRSISSINQTTLNDKLPVQKITYPETTDNSINRVSIVPNTTTEAVKTPIKDHKDLSSVGNSAIIPIIIAISIIFIIVCVIALFIFRNQICNPFGRKFKKSKVDKAKKSNQSIQVITLSDESSRNSMVMQHWNGPMAFNNRYTPWASDHDRIQHHISNSSFTYIGGDVKVPGFDRWEFPRHRLKVFNILGEGAFGQVWRCEATDIDGVEGISTVAVKTLKENAIESEKNDLMSELNVMKSLDPHLNVVRLIGCCTEKDPVFVIIEYVALGKLQTFLRNSRMEKNYNNTSDSNGKSKNLTSLDLISFMYQVARGMEFLTSRGIIHRDLAARNVLITEDHTCKVADFGFARDVVTSKVYERKSEGRLPIRWMAIESLYDNLFSVKSDIWSFGILMWEIVTLGSTPYPGMGAADVMKKVRDGYRLEKPDHCRRELYNIMYYCWAKDAEARPEFNELVQMCDKLLVTETDYIELERFPDHNYYNMLNISGEKL